MYLSELQQWRQDELMFQSKLSPSASYETRLVKRVFSFNSASDNITSYLQMYGVVSSGSSSSDNTSSATT